MGAVSVPAHLNGWQTDHSASVLEYWFGDYVIVRIGEPHDAEMPMWMAMFRAELRLPMERLSVKGRGYQWAIEACRKHEEEQG